MSRKWKRIKLIKLPIKYYVYPFEHLKTENNITKKDLLELLNENKGFARFFSKDIKKYAREFLKNYKELSISIYKKCLVEAYDKKRLEYNIQFIPFEILNSFPYQSLDKEEKIRKSINEFNEKYASVDISFDDEENDYYFKYMKDNNIIFNKQYLILDLINKKIFHESDNYEDHLKEIWKISNELKRKWVL
jgi:hypothetical protein